MSAVGEISYLAKNLMPNITVITGIAPCHLQYFNSLEDIAKAKS